MTTSFLPLEVYELAERISVAKIAVILVNIAIVETRTAKKSSAHPSQDQEFGDSAA